MKNKNYKYDIAFAFLKKDEHLANQINDLIHNKLNTFLYSKKQEGRALRNRDKVFFDVFANQSRVVVLIYRSKWGTTPWTEIEEKLIRARVLDEGEDFLLLIPLDNPPITPKYLPKAQIWADLPKSGIKGAVKAIEVKVQLLGQGLEKALPINLDTENNSDTLFKVETSKFLESVNGLEISKLELKKLFTELSTCPPGMLQNADGLPAEPKDFPDDFPLRISWSGIIVDHEGHSEDIISRVREAIEVIWEEKANDIEQEVCEILGVRDLREYFAKPGKFFVDHLKRYSKSRRQAPIYWPLSTPSGSYTLWLYYHRLTHQTLYTCVNNFVGPKLKQVSDDTEQLRRKTNRSSQEEKDLEKLSDLALELKDFHDELLRIASFWKPNLNDGVQITAAPLWKLFQFKPWQNKLKQTWKDLEKGKYDWAHLAYSIWPERVIKASHKDRSYAIAHNLESELWEEVETGTDRQGNPKTKWVPKKLSAKELDKIIHEKMNE